MSKEEAKKKIKDIFLQEYKYVHKENERISLFKKLIKISEKNDLPAYSTLFRGYLEWAQDKHQTAILHFEKSIDDDEYCALSWYGMGNIHFDLELYQKATECYKKSIEIDENFAYSWYRMGNIFEEAGDYQRAKEYYNKAIEIDENFADPWHRLGNVYYKGKDFENALKYYKEGTEIDKDFVLPWIGLGNVYYEKGETENAIKCYNKAIEIDESIANSWLGLGNVYYIKKDYNKAVLAYEKSLKLFEKEKNEYWMSVSEEMFEEARNRLKLKREKFDKQTDPIRRVLKKTQDSEFREKSIEDSILDNKKSSLAFIEEKTVSEVSKDIYLLVLKRWNSFTPIFTDSYYISKGGGYFLKIKGLGIVIDPGLDFIDNFQHSGHLFHEIDIVLMSHAHYDHTADLESILTLLYEYNDEIKKSIRIEIAEKKELNKDKVSTESIEKEFSKRRKTIDFYMTCGVFKKFSGLFELYTRNVYNIHIVEPKYRTDLKNKNKEDCFSLEVIPAKHDDVISDKYSVGFILELRDDDRDTVLIYTGDTRWDEEIEKAYKDIFEKYKDFERFLIAHLGGFGDDEWLYFSRKMLEDKNPFHSKHLGRLGLVKINEVLKPKICFISEFGEEMKEDRIGIANAFQEAFDDKITFLPADIGLKFNFNSQKIEALTKANTKGFKLIKDEIKPNEVKTYQFDLDCSLHYYKKSSVYNEKRLIEILLLEHKGTPL